MFQQLVPLFKDGLLQTDHQNNTALAQITMSSAALRDRYESARILLSEIENSCSGDEQQELVRVAARLGGLEVPLPALASEKDGQKGSKEEHMAEEEKMAEEEQKMLAILRGLRKHGDATSTPAG
ncbi:hypothetical protein G6O67_000120 [Ophiocordyceps sinensis]|uniref:Uncharacterized protein n=1 Tax=Ophiocordyceps sinensis TaxID=72228 RepID=A0A8H4V9L7_9HYPO|nr:hypothetical protein G6O67_000120 [Ophiocordyceps sinensis]